MVRTANDGITAIETAIAFQPHVVFLDIGLPGADGCEVARQLRARGDLRGAALVAMTGHGQDADHQRARQAGFDHHLVKPVDPETVDQLLSMLATRPDPAD